MTLPIYDAPTVVHFTATREKPDRWNMHADYAASSFPLYGQIASLYLGTHVGWMVDGVQYPRCAFEEHYFAGSFTGCAPVGLTPLISLP